ncbi:MAG: glucose 1-dehydrogenase [Chloroflexi bacterium]|nr:glucose 1-dehydrogenase [Chloroflexota bacterium]
MRLEGKVALISGGARGIGAAEARLLAREGAVVVIGDVLEKEGRQLEEEINESGGRALFTRLDVTSEEDWQRAVQLTVDTFGKLDILVNNAGIIIRAPIEQTSVETWDTTMAVNAKGVFLGTKAVLPGMRQAGGGSIVNLSSSAGIVGSVAAAAYSASKGAVRLFTKSTAIQHARDGIRVNSVHPGPINAPMMDEIKVDSTKFQESVNIVPLGRFGEPEEVAYAVLFLASDESSYVTGSELVVDGGVTAH